MRLGQRSDQYAAPPPADAPTQEPGPVRKKASLAELLAELKRRRVFRVMAGYGIFAFAVLQVIEPIMHGAHLGEWVLTAVLVGLAAGFPVALILSWVFDFTAEGVVRTPRVSGSPRFSRGRVAAVLVGVGLLAALPGLGWYAWKRGAEATPAAGSASIAVLPFDDLSPNHDQDYFSDGVAQEILDALSRVEGLKVPGRASCFWFKGKNAEPSEIANKLGVAHLLQGSVRRSGKKLRITAELTRVATGERLWSQTFNREEADVLAVQDEIARDVVDALKLKLLPGQAAAAARRPPVPEAYDGYLLGRQLLGQFSYDAHDRAVAPLERATQLDPQFAQAWAALAIALKYRAEQTADRATALDGKRRALEAAERSIALAPEAAEGYVARSLQADVRGWAWTEGLADARRAVELNPQSADAHRAVGMALATLGRVGEGVLELQRATELEPLSSWMWNGYGWLALCDGKYELARRALARALEINPDNQSSPGNVLMIKLLEGRAAEVLAEVGRVKVHEAERLEFVAVATHTLGRTKESQAALALLEKAFGEQWPQLVANVHAWRVDRAEAIAWLERARDRIGGSVDEVLYDPFLNNLRQDPAFTAFIATINLAAGARGAAVAPQAAPSIAVLPFADMSPGRDQEYFADGVAEEILNALAHLEGLKVIGRSSSFSFKGKREDLRAIGQALGVTSILEGSLRLDGNLVRVSAQLIRVADGSQLWSERYERKLDGIFKVQDEIARAVVGALKVRLLSGATPAPGRARSTTPEAYAQYLRGRSDVEAARAAGLPFPVAAFERAIALDPTYAPAWAALADTLQQIGPFVETAAERTGRLERALAAAERAVALDPGLAEGWEDRGNLRGYVRWDFPGRLADYQKGLALNPGSARAHRRMGLHHFYLGRASEAQPWLLRAVELDPLDVRGLENLSELYIWQGRHAEAQRLLKRSLELSPGFSWGLEALVVSYVLEGKPAEARAFNDRITDPHQRLLGEVLIAEALGDLPKARSLLQTFMERYGEVDPTEVATLHAALGDADQAMAWLERAWQARDLYLAGTAKSDVFLRKYQGDPRYVALLRKLKMPVD
jgi:TolB-like protein/Flp pilus assembly protein TadD